MDKANNHKILSYTDEIDESINFLLKEYNGANNLVTMSPQELRDFSTWLEKNTTNNNFKPLINFIKIYADIVDKM